MPFARTLAVCALLAAPLALARAQSGAELPEGRSWQKPATATAEAAAAKAAEASSPAPVTAATSATATVAPVTEAAGTGTAPVTPATDPDSAPTTAPSVAAATASSDAESPPAATPPADVPAKGAKGAKAKKAAPVPAKELFGAAKAPAPLAARAIGWYAKGCLAGAKPIAVDGPAWQVMRLSRNRNWGHPEMIALLERFASDVKQHDNWPGLLLGDIAQPRGGPMTSGHASHQVGLDADVWLTPMPDRRLTEKEREDISATSMLAADDISVDPKVWGEGQVKIIKRAASYRQVERVLVHPAIKKALCEAAGTDRGWLAKVRPYWGHYYHFHIRIGCPTGSKGCTSQPPPPGDDGCGAELKHWVKLITPPKAAPEPKVAEKPAKPEKKKPDIMLAQLPADCRAVLAAGEEKPSTGKPAATAGAAANDAPKDAPRTAAQR